MHLSLRSRLRRALLLLPLAALLGPAQALSDPPSRALLLELSRRPRLAGTPESRWAVELVARRLREAGLEVELDPREVLLSLPRKLELELFAGPAPSTRLAWRSERFDPDALPPGDIPPFNSWSASAELRAPVVYAGQGLRADFERLRAAGIETRGAIALMRYGGAYRGLKARMAQEHGCVGALLFSHPSDDGAERGEVWPRGPWKPDWEAQRGSILPMIGAPGDPTTPGWASPAPGQSARRIGGEELAASLPRIPCMPIPWREARVLLEALAEREITGADGQSLRARVGPGPVEARMLVDAPRELRTIVNVIGRLAGSSDTLVAAGNHRDAWVRGATDAGGGTVALLRAAQMLGERKRQGWRPASTILLCFWDGEEHGLLGSTEWVEARAVELSSKLVAYVNADTLVHGISFRGASGNPGLLGTLRRALERVPAVEREGSLWDAWVDAAGESGPRLGLPGSGSDFAAFAHHLCLPVLDLGLGGAGGGHYHTSFDDFALVERFIDPGFRGHEAAALLVCELVAELAEREHESIDEVEAATELARHAREAASWLGAERAEQLGLAFDELAARSARAGGPRRPDQKLFYASLAAGRGLAGRPWYRNRLWAPARESGYGSETFPELRAAAERGGDELDEAVAELVAAVKIQALLRAPDELGGAPAARGAGGE